MRQTKSKFVLFFILMIMMSTTAYAQFEEPDIIKIESEDASKFQAQFRNIKWTGQGFNPNELDNTPAIQIRARLESVYGHPTRTIEDIVDSGKYRAGKAIQFEYWFIVDGKMPMMILDLDGPFEDGLVYVGASRYIDLMPAVKRKLTRDLTGTEPKEFTDFFFSPERNQWFEVKYADGEYSKKEIDKPSHINF